MFKCPGICHAENDCSELVEQNEEANKIAMPEGVDPELLAKVLSNPEMVNLLTALAKNMK